MYYMRLPARSCKKTEVHSTSSLGDPRPKPVISLSLQLDRLAFDLAQEWTETNRTTPQ